MFLRSGADDHPRPSASVPHVDSFSTASDAAFSFYDALNVSSDLPVVSSNEVPTLARAELLDLLSEIQARVTCLDTLLGDIKLGLSRRSPEPISMVMLSDETSPVTSNTIDAVPEIPSIPPSSVTEDSMPCGLFFGRYRYASSAPCTSVVSECR